MKIPLSYNPATGEFTWLDRDRCTRTAKPGYKAGTVGSKVYVIIKINGKTYRAHRLAWFVMHGKWPDGQIDHINGNKQDNRISNLRDVDGSVNSQNRNRANRNSKTGLIGVSREGRRFVAAIYVSGVHRRIGSFPTADEAYAAYLAEKRRLHPGASSIFLGDGQATDSTQSGKGSHSVHRHHTSRTQTPPPVQNQPLVRPFHVVVGRLIKRLARQVGGSIKEGFSNVFVHSRMLQRGLALVYSHFPIPVVFVHGCTVGRGNANKYVHARQA